LTVTGASSGAWPANISRALNSIVSMDRGYSAQRPCPVIPRFPAIGAPGGISLYKDTMEHLVQPTLDFIAVHSNWAVVIMFVTAFGESFAFISLLFPGTSLLIAAGALMAVGSLPYFPIIAGAVIGAVLGDTVSFWIGHRFGGGIARVWPFSRRPELLPSGIRFFARHGGKSVFIGRFLGPMRAVVPLAAGVMRMRRDRFWFVNVTSALVWAPMLLFAGDTVGDLGDRLIGSANTVVVVFAGLTLFGIAGIAWAAMRSARSKA
jgi:membrane protein DedA with SNARE-associated domain